MCGHKLFLSNFLALDPVFKIKSAQRRYRDALVRVRSMEENSPFSKCFARPFFERESACEIVYMLLVQFAYSTSQITLRWLESVYAQMLDRIIRNAKYF